MKVRKSDWLVKPAEIFSPLTRGNQGRVKIATFFGEVSRFESLLGTGPIFNMRLRYWVCDLGQKQESSLDSRRLKPDPKRREFVSIST